MGDKMEDVTKINQTEPVQTDRQSPGSYNRKKQKKRRPYKEAKKYFSHLTRIVDETHKELEQKDSPFRLCVYQDGEDIFIDIVTIDESGKITRVFKHDISHNEFEELVSHIKSGRGLLLDADA